jgi:iron complex outermembrane receptor protein
LNFDDEIKIQSSLLFLNTELDLPAGFYLTAGLSYNRLNYNLNRLVTNLQDDEPGVAEKSFDPEVIPRIGMVRKFSPALSLHGSISYGFSPPTIEEFRTNEGSIALNLEAEQGTNYEMGLRGTLAKLRFSYDITGFIFKLSETIVQQPSDRNSTVVFENTGATDQYGIEVATGWQVVQNNGLFFEGLAWDLSYSYHDFSFVDYQKEGEDYSGNDLTGVAPHNLNSNWKLNTSIGFYMNLNYNFTDEIPLNDANTVYSEAYHLLQSKLGYRIDLLDNLILDVFFGVDNLLDEKYSLGNDLNAFGDRFYQPAAPRNWFGGLKVNMEL